MSNKSVFKSPYDLFLNLLFLYIYEMDILYIFCLKMEIIDKIKLNIIKSFLLLGSAEGHEYSDFQVGDEVNPRLSLI